jgi:hypothetical protein
MAGLNAPFPIDQSTRPVFALSAHVRRADNDEKYTMRPITLAAPEILP